jgi:hypothetical protein
MSAYGAKRTFNNHKKEIGRPGVAKSVTWPAYSYIPALSRHLFISVGRS